MAITGRFKGGKAKKKSKALPILLSVFGVLIILGGIGFVLAQTETEKRTYMVKVRLDATSGYPLHLTGFNVLEIKRETILASILPSLNFRGLDITEPYASMSGEITIDCGQGYNQTRDFYIETNRPGERLTQTFVFKDVLPDRYCKVLAVADECQTNHINPLCLKGTGYKVAYNFKIPE